MVATNCLLERVTGACEAAFPLEAAGPRDVEYDASALPALAASLTSEEVRSGSGSTALPLRFDDVAQEATLLGLLALLDFGSGWEGALLSAGGRSRAEILQYGCLALHLGAERGVTTAHLSDFSGHAILTTFGVDVAEESELRPGIMVSRRGPLGTWADSVKGVLNETGAALQGADFGSLGEAVLACAAREGAPPGAAPSASRFVENLIAVLPAFSDVTRDASGGITPFHRRAQRLAGDLAARFGADPASPFAFGDLGLLAFDSGAEGVAALVRAGVLVLGGEVARVLAEGEDFAGSGGETALRAAAVVAGREAARAVGVQPWQLSRYLTSRGRQGGEGLVWVGSRGSTAY